MPGTAKTSAFMLSTATVMIGAMDKLHKLNPDTNSIGLVKNFQVSSDPKLIELGQGLPNQTVMSVKADEGVKCSMEVYEYTNRNIAYAAGLDGTSGTYDPISTQYVTSASTAPAATTFKVATDLSAVFTSGLYVYLQQVGSDVVHIAKVTSSAYSSPDTTVTITGYPTPTGVTFATGSTVGIIPRVDVGGSTASQANLSAKVVGLLPTGNKPFVILFPKIRITKGVGVSFNIDNFGNLPFEFTPYAQLPSDTFYADYGLSPMVLFPAG